MNFLQALLWFIQAQQEVLPKILSDQKIKSESMDSEMLNNLDRTKELGRLSLELIQNKDFKGYGKIMHEHWMNKKQRSPGMTSKEIDEIYEYGLASGANGGKVIGAGGGGFILFQTEDKKPACKEVKRK